MSNGKTTVIVALIGLVGTITTAVVTNLDKIKAVNIPDHNNPSKTDEEIGEVDCASESGLKSVVSETSTNIQFKNDSDDLVKVYWIDYEGNRKFYKDLQPNDVYVQQTYISHPWVVTGVEENCLGIYFPKVGQGNITIY